METESDYIYKVVLVGDVNVGKTYLLMRYIHGEIPENVPNTIGVEFAPHKVQLKDGGTVKAQIWDTAGQEKYKAIIRAHFRRAAGALVVYDITNESSYMNVETWVKELRENADEDVVMMLVGTKLDLVHKNPTKRKIAKEKAQMLADKHGMMFIETSSTQDYKVTESFENLIFEIYDRRNRIANESIDYKQQKVVANQRLSEVQTKKDDNCAFR